MLESTSVRPQNGWRIITEMEGIKFLAFSFMYLQLQLVAPAPMDAEDCELHAPSTMHEFCCDIHDEYVEFRDCELEWNDKIHTTNDEAEMNYNFCLSECVYNATRFLGPDRKSLRMKTIKRHLSELHGDEEGEAMVYKTFEVCHKHALDMLKHAKVQQLASRLGKYNCHPYPGLVFECVSNELILKCPPEKFHNTAQCEHVKQYLEDCFTPKTK